MKASRRRQVPGGGLQESACGWSDFSRSEGNCKLCNSKATRYVLNSKTNFAS